MTYYKTSTCEIKYTNKGAYITTHKMRLYLSNIMAYKAKEIGFNDCKALDNIPRDNNVAVFNYSAFSGLLIVPNNTGEECKVIPFLSI